MPLILAPDRVPMRFILLPDPDDALLQDPGVPVPAPEPWPYKYTPPMIPADMKAPLKPLNTALRATMASNCHLGTCELQRLTVPLR